MDRAVVKSGGPVPAWSVVALLAWGVLTFGAVYGWAYWPLFLGALVIGGAGIVQDRAWHDPRLARILVVLGIVIGAIGLQTLALPASLVVELSPGVDRFFSLFRLGYDSSQLNALSLDPDATRVVLFEVLALGALLVGLARMMRRWPLDRMASHLMMLGVAISIVGILQKAVLASDDSTLIYGFWQPQLGGEPFGPFVNRNHFAGWMVMVMPLVAAYGWALAQTSPHRGRGGIASWLRWLMSVDGNRVFPVLAALLTMLVAVALTGSRSGMVAGAAGLAALLVLVWRRLTVSARVLAASVLILVFVAATMWAGAGTVAARFGRAAGDAGGRLAAWQDTTRIVRDFAMFGTGLGGYRRAMVVYQTGDREALYAQAHNDYLQLLAEGGLLVTVPAVVLIVFVVGGIMRRLRAGDADPVTHWLRRGAVAGLVGIAAQSVVEFSLQIPGNTVLFVVLTALALHRPRHHSSHAHRV